MGLLMDMFSPRIAAGACRVGLVVGSLLNAINQGWGVWHGADVDWARFALNYAVPFLVASYSAAQARQAMEG